MEQERCVVCDRKMGFDEPVTISETGYGGVCADCAGLITYIYEQGTRGMVLTKEDADSLARKWVAGEVAPEDFDPRIAEWKSEQSVRQAVKEGELHQKQVSDELARRQDAGRFQREMPAFVDQHPVPGIAEARERRQRIEDEMEATREAQRERETAHRAHVRERIKSIYTNEDAIEHLVDEAIDGEYMVPGLEYL
jgi:hypothetical protein